MERNINSLLGYNMKANDGVIGEVKEFYFDDKTWHIRYIIIKTGDWLIGREILIAPHAIENTDRLDRVFRVNLTKKQITDSPDIDTDKPVSRQQEIALYDHYAWEGYWFSGFYPGGYLGVSLPFPSINQKGTVLAEYAEKGANNDLHLRSTEKVTGYHVHATDGDIGHLHDFVLDDQTWQLLYLVIDTHNWLGGKKVLVSVGHVKRIEWDNSKVFVDVTIASIEGSKAFDELDFNPPETENGIIVTMPVIPNEIH